MTSGHGLTGEEELYLAATEGNESEVKRIFKDHPSQLNVNWRNEEDSGFTALHRACQNDHGAIVSILLAHPHIDVNQKNKHGATPSFWACYKGFSSFSLLLQDSRVDLNEPNIDGHSPLRWAAYFGYLYLIEWWIASGREMDLGEPGNVKTDAIDAARRNRKTEVATLLERFSNDPAETRSRVRSGLGITGLCTPSPSHFAVCS